MRCIFCKTDSTGSRSIEHIIPESIGSRKRILPRGVVCDECNSYFAVKVEQPVLSHAWMRNVRAWQQVPNKKGTYPSMVGHIAGTNVAINMRRGPDGRIKVATEKQKEAEILNRVIAAGFEQPLLFKIEDTPPEKEMARFLCKMGLETAAELYSGDPNELERLVDEPFFDNVRTFARYGTNFTDWPYSQRRVFPHDTLMRHPDSGDWVQAGFGCGLFMTKRRETLFAFIFYGVEFVTNLGGPSIAGYNEWLVDHNGISPVVERVGCRLLVEGEGKKARYFLHGAFEAHRGLEFDRKHGYAAPLGID